jgi:hypothetical protein
MQWQSVIIFMGDHPNSVGYMGAGTTSTELFLDASNIQKLTKENNINPNIYQRTNP